MTSKNKMTLGSFMLGVAQGGQERQHMTELQAEEVQAQLSVRLIKNVEEFRSSQRKNSLNFQTITVF